jgi:ATP-dependent Lhr-like helicase
VLLAGGEPVAYLERGGHSVLTFAAAAADDRWVDALAGLVKDGRLRTLEVRTVDGDPAGASPWAGALRQAGFQDGYRGLVLRSS